MTTQKKLRVMLADDTASFRGAFREALEAVGCEVAEAADGEQALAKLTTPGARFDLVLLDQVMPGLSGSDVVRALAERRVPARVVLLSGVRGQRKAAGELPPKYVEAVLDKGRPLEDLSYAVNNILFARTRDGRKWPRVPLKAMAQYRAEEGWHVGRIFDLSHGGLQLRGSIRLEPKAAVELKFFLPRVSGAIEARAEVLWHRRVPGAASNPESHGLKFTQIGATAHKQVVRFVDTRVDEMLSS